MLIEITRSARAALFLTVGAALLVLQAALACVAYAVLTRSSLGASRDLVTAAGWVAFVGLAAGLAAVAVTTWDAALGAGWTRGAELVAAVGASLLIVVGQLVVAANGANGSDAGSVVIAVGVGGWSAVTLFGAGRRSIAERAGGLGRQSDLWLLASGSLLVLAVASGLPAPNGPGRALPIATAVLFLVAYAGLAATFEGSTRRGFIPSGRIRVLVTGLLALAAAYLVLAITSGFVFGPGADFITLRVGLSIPQFLMVVAWAVIAFASFGRLSDLTAPSLQAAQIFPIPPGGVATEPLPPPPPPAQPAAGRGWSLRRSAPTPEAAGRAVTQPASTSSGGMHCGEPLPPGAAFCPRCGHPVGSGRPGL